MQLLYLLQNDAGWTQQDAAGNSICCVLLMLLLEAIEHVGEQTYPVSMLWTQCWQGQGLRCEVFNSVQVCRT
jgi:hypothetical protein